MRSTLGVIHYTTPEVKIGKHEWRLVVFSATAKSQRYTAHQFREIGAYMWIDYHEWPSYNFNDGCFAGLPKSLANKWGGLWGEIKAVISGYELNGVQLSF